MLHVPLFRIHETPVTMANIVTFCGVLIAFWLLAKCVKSGVMRIKMLKHHVNETSLFGFGRLAYYIVLFVGLYIALMIVGIDLTGIAVIAGALSVGIGFGLQSIFNNLAAGIILISEKKVRIGDVIQCENNELGIVEEINMRSTLVHTFDKRKIVIPNADIVSKKLVNWTLDPKGHHRFRIPFSVKKGESKETIRSVALEVGKKLNKGEAPPEVWLTRLSEAHQEFELVLSMKVEHSVTSECLWQLESALQEKGIHLVQASRGGPIQEF